MSNDPFDYSIVHAALRNMLRGAHRDTFEDRVAAVRAAPGYAEGLAEKAAASRVTRVVRDGDWQARRRAEQEANYQPARPQYPAPNPRAE